MQVRHHIILTSIAVGGGEALPADAQTMDVAVTIPRLTVAEYHRPYVSIWVEKQGAAPRTIAVWYDQNKKNNEGAKWLSDIRQWWRASGRTMKFPADGITGATRAPGEQKISFTAGKGALGTLTPGDYTLVIEAAREVGGREALRLPFAWPPKAGTTKAEGKTELGTASLSFRK